MSVFSGKRLYGGEEVSSGGDISKFKKFCDFVVNNSMPADRIVELPPTYSIVTQALVSVFSNARMVMQSYMIKIPDGYTGYSISYSPSLYYIEKILIGKDFNTEKATLQFTDDVFKGYEVSEENPNLKSINGSLLSKDGKNLLHYNLPSGATECNLQDSFPNVTHLRDYCFYFKRSLRSIVLPNGIKILGESCLRGCALQTVSIPKGCTTIEANAFWSNTPMNNIYIPDSVVSIGRSAFGACKSLNTIYTDIGNSARLRGMLTSDVITGTFNIIER